jgi:hypothetical protein
MGNRSSTYSENENPLFPATGEEKQDKKIKTLPDNKKTSKASQIKAFVFHKEI